MDTRLSLFKKVVSSTQGKMAANAQHLLEAVKLALAQDWDGAHSIAQDYSDPTANWIHAVLHKIEGDAWNSRYWYARTNGKRYEDFEDPHAELISIQSTLNANQNWGLNVDGLRAF